MNRKFWFFLVGMVSLFAAPVLAAEGELAKLGMAIGAGVAIGVAALGGGIGQGRLVAGALEGIARNPNAADRMFVPMILGLAFIESLSIYGLLVAILIKFA